VETEVGTLRCSNARRRPSRRTIAWNKCLWAGSYIL